MDWTVFNFSLLSCNLRAVNTFKDSTPSKKNRKSLSPSLKQVKNQGLFLNAKKKVNDNIKSVCDITLQANEHNESLINIYLQGARQDNRDTQDNSCIIKQTYFMLVLIVNRMLVRATTPNS